MDGQYFSKQTNCLNLIRIIAAFQVMFGHMVEHLELPINETAFRMSYFFRGVPIFFVISGFLMWFSIGRSKTYSQYLKKRFWRIYPELWVAVLIEIGVILVLYKGGYKGYHTICFWAGNDFAILDSNLTKRIWCWDSQWSFVDNRCNDSILYHYLGFLQNNEK